VRYYEITQPGDPEPIITTRLRGLKNLPPGTTITACVTERDGTLADSWNIPIENGKPVVRSRNKNTPRYYGLR
jgi:hypothetical protein